MIPVFSPDELRTMAQRDGITVSALLTRQKNEREKRLLTHRHWAWTRAMLEKHLAEQPQPMLRQFRWRVMMKYRVTRADLESSSLEPHVTMARAEFAYLSRTHTDASFPAIGSHINKHHTTIMTAFKKYKHWQAVNAGMEKRTPADRYVNFSSVLPGDAS